MRALRNARPRRLMVVASVLLAAIVGACSTDPTGSPSPRSNVEASDSTATTDSIADSSTTSSPDTTAGDTTVDGGGTTAAIALTRDAELLTAYGASALIDSIGGVIEVREAGLRVTVPAGAVSGPTRITVTALPGSLVAYEFQPHGIVFQVPITVRQDLGGTNWFRLSNHSQMEAGYFPDASSIDAATGLVQVREFIPTVIDVNSRKAQFQVSHFSGYMLSTGRR